MLKNVNIFQWFGINPNQKCYAFYCGKRYAKEGSEVMRKMNVDRELAKCLAYCGAAREEDLQRIVSKNRQKEWVKQGLCKRKSFHKNGSKKADKCLVLTKKGKEYVRKNYGYSQGQKVKEQYNHNCKLAEVYTKLSQSERNNVMSEQQARDWYKEMIEQTRDRSQEEADKMYQDLIEHKIAVVDMVVVRDTGVIQGIEITTSSYSQEEIQMHIDFCENAHIEYVEIRA